MKTRKHIGVLLVFLFTGIALFSQNNAPNAQQKDSIKTEIVEVVTSYTPKISDAFKLQQHPNVKRVGKSTKKNIQYRITPSTVVSTFTPKKGALKMIDLGKKELLYKNYIAVGYGNYNTPFLETFIRYNTRFENDFGLYARYQSANKNTPNSLLESGYSNIQTNLYYQQEERYLDWEIRLNSQREQYNWYGVSPDFFQQATLDVIDEVQTYNFIETTGSIQLKEAFINQANITTSYFTDLYGSKEYHSKLTTELQLPLTFISNQWQDLFLDISVDYLAGKFRASYFENSPLQHAFLNLSAQPHYQFNIQKTVIKLGAKMYYTSDLEHSITQFYGYPDVRVSIPIYKEHVTMYLGATGDLHTNSFRAFSQKNPYISPTLYNTQTNEMYRFFTGFHGKISQNIAYNLKVSYSNEEDKALFTRQASKSDGTSIDFEETPFLGYEYGNSFAVHYDDVKTTAVFAEIEVEPIKDLIFGGNLHYHHYQTKTAEAAWNLPAFKGSLFGAYKGNKWYAGTDVYFVGNRTERSFLSTAQVLDSTKKLNSYMDINLNGGYHFNDKLAVFVKLNNLLNKSYQRFANVESQGLQVLGGATFKFDF